MKYITFAVPCYNSENYMRRCVDSLLIGGKDVEIILIDDGSSDRTAQIAEEISCCTEIGHFFRRCFTPLSVYSFFFRSRAPIVLYGVKS